MIFKASPDKLVRVVTTIITIVFLAVIVFGFVSFLVRGRGALIVPSFVLGLVYLICYLLHPLEYEIAGDELIIRRPVNSIRLAKQSIQSVEMVDHSGLKNSIRVFGVGGLFGYFGKFTNTAIGSMVWYATRRDYAVLITTFDNKRIIITPDEPVEFMQSL